MPKGKGPKGISPVNGQPIPRGRQFTSETARQARQKRTEKEAAKKSITEAFKANMTKEFTDAKTGKVMTGAEIMAQSIINGAMHGNAKMIELALAIMGETPVQKVGVTIDVEDLTPLADMLK